ncbi:hypothetical protein, partial [uncultured Alistipes sp.]|uniref:hypothetical protein n=1 Tax=uncultured Alistipes sp. TaxID=538949 RepID=UPI0025D9FD3C
MKRNKDRRFRTNKTAKTNNLTKRSHCPDRHVLRAIPPHARPGHSFRHSNGSLSGMPPQKTADNLCEIPDKRLSSHSEKQIQPKTQKR